MSAIRVTRRRSLQDKAFGGQNPTHRRGGQVHQLKPGATRRQLAVGPVDAAPGLEQVDDRGRPPPAARAPRRQRTPCRPTGGPPDGPASLRPGPGPGRAAGRTESSTSARRGRDRPEPADPPSPARRLAAGPGRRLVPTRFSLVQMQRHRLLAHRRPQPLGLQPRGLQRALPAHPAGGDHRRAVHPVPVGGLPLGWLAYPVSTAT